MSFSQQALEDLQYSFNSLYTPSYSIAGLLPLAASAEEDFASQKPTSRKTSEHASSSDESLKHESSPRLDKTEILFSSSPLETKQTEPPAPHYRKLKMNYFRKLNVVQGQGATISSETHEVAQKSPRTGKTDKSPQPTPSSKFIPSFTATPTRSSQPIKIPTTKPSKSSRQRFEEETSRDGKKKSSQMAFSLKREDSLDHFGVFDSDFEI